MGIRKFLFLFSITAEKNAQLLKIYKHKYMFILASLLIGATSLTPSYASVEAQAVNSQPGFSGHNNASLPDFVQIVKKVKPAVVSISAKMKESDLDDEQDVPSDHDNDGSGNFGLPFPFPFQMLPQQPSNRVVETRGSGFIISPQGDIVTNNHVIKGAQRVQVTLDDGTTYVAHVVGSDAKTDIALLRINKVSTPLPYIAMGNSDDVQPGQWVVAVGNPFGLGGTVTAGIISALGRDLHAGAYNDFIQVDAPINQGNSGGPLITADGKVIGVNSMIVSPNGGGSVGIGFAIPSNTVKNVIDQLTKTGHVVRGSLGISVQDINRDMARALGLSLPNPGAPAKGALVATVNKGSPAEKAGIKPGDVILGVNKEPINGSHDLVVHITQIPPGHKGVLDIWRNKTKISISFQSEAMENVPKDIPLKGSNQIEQNFNKIGLTLSSLTDNLRHQLAIADSVNGALVTHIMPESLAERSGLERLDIITSVNLQPVNSPSDVVTSVQNSIKARNPALLQILRHGQRIFVALQVKSHTDSDIEDLEQ